MALEVSVSLSAGRFVSESWKLLFITFLSAFAVACGSSTSSPASEDGAGDPCGDVHGGEFGFDLPDLSKDTGADTAAPDADASDLAQEILPGAFGAPCIDNGDCDSELCVEGPEGYVCTQRCITDCPEGYNCRSINIGADIEFLCLPVFIKGCALCAQDSQCNGGRCVELDGRRGCFAPCEGDEDCAEPGFACEERYVPSLDDTSSLCIPVTGSCTCYEAGSEGALRTCIAENDHGTCYGVRACALETGWSACDAPEPEQEICDGLDQDCDGQIDEALPTTMACEATGEGMGACLGEATCMGSLGWVCGAPTPEQERCDGLDNDCDGETDEDFLVDGVYASLEHCGGCDQSCAGAIANAFERCEAVADGDEPACVVDDCDPGFFQLDSQHCVSLDATLCGSCDENIDCAAGLCVALGDAMICSAPCPLGVAPNGYDCVALDGYGDVLLPSSGACGCDDASAGQARSCFQANEAGACYGFEICDPALGWVGCNAEIPAAETCNGLDDDCDGAVDEDLAADEACTNEIAGIGACQGVWSCQGPLGLVCSARVPALETCDYLDDDCDGTVDEGFLNGDLYDTDANCGVCGNDCADVIANGTGACAVAADGGASCVVGTCDEGFHAVGGVACVEAPEALCSPCTEDIHCVGGLCRTIGDGSFCTRPCDAESPCPDGSTCSTVADEDLCMPASGTCDCSESNSGDTRLCQHATAVGTCYGVERCQPGLGGWSGCDAAFPVLETCNGLDDDCDGVVDDGVAPAKPCERYVEDIGTCVGEAVCTGIGADDGYECLAPLPEVERCDFKDNDCDGLTDEDFVSVDATSGAVLYSDVEHCGTCGVACADQVENASARCEVSDGVPHCVVDVCLPGFAQVNDTQCVAAPERSCQLCNADADCPGGICTVLDGKGVCLAPCDLASPDCAPGYVCDSLGDGQVACAPLTGTCDCTDLSAGSKRPCYFSNGYGACLGFQTCIPETGWSSCDAATPAPETCDGLDNDCDGGIDDDLPSSQACDITNEHGSCGGDAFCYGASGWVCQANEPGAEICDYKDNNCDGEVDEPFAVEGRYLDFDNCGTCGMSCGVGFPHATTVCSGEAVGGFPECVVESCDEGYVQLNAFQCIPNIAKLCDPCASDENCIVDGARCVDIGDEGRFCGLPCESQADCDDAISGYLCTDFGAFKQCTPATESCGCDGNTPGLSAPCSAEVTGGDGPSYTCFGAKLCTSTGWSDCVLPEEECNLADDDCDGEIDEGFKDAEGAYASDENCGKCGNNCTLLSFGNAAGVCNTTVAPVRCGPVCDEGYMDLDENPNDCECHFLSETDHPGVDYPDQGEDLDVNCDGIDGQKELAVFVAKNGDDANDGTILSPLLSIQAGIDRAAEMGKRDVYVATGVYSEAISLAANVAVYGGYSADFRVRDVILYESALLGPAPTPERPGAVNAIGIAVAGEGLTVFDGFVVFGSQVKEAGASSYAVYVRNSDASLRVTNNRVYAGSGGKGTRGGDGLDGDDGQPGSGGAAAFDLFERYGLQHCAGLPDEASYTSVGGAGGVFTCGGTDVSGGAGGDRVCPAWDDSTDKTSLPVASEFGSPGVNNEEGGAGGAPGRDVDHQAYSCDGYSSFGVVEGGIGVDGDSGDQGVGGLGCQDGLGSVLDGLWRAAAGADGSDGSAGAGGGGGGSGAGAWVHQSCFAKGFGYDNLGGTGGGGGSGGCAGAEGLGGLSGGGAFSIFVILDSPQLSTPRIEDNHLRRGFGGDGADGGIGGVGGAGGAGAAGGAGGGGYSPPTVDYPAFAGGKGAQGGQGGHGGGGGGGCGGPAIALFAEGVTPETRASWAASNQVLPGGAGGAAGRGGFSLGEPGQDGAPGAALETN